MSGGVLTNLASLPVSSPYGKLRFTVAGVSLKLFLNGNLISYASDASVTAAGAVGIDGTPGTTFQNFSADVVPVASTSLTFTDSLPTTTFGSQLDSNWTNRFGNISVDNSNQAVARGAVNVSTVNGINAADVKVTGDFALTGTGVGGLVARFSGPLNDNYY